MSMFCVILEDGRDFTLSAWSERDAVRRVMEKIYGRGTVSRVRRAY